MYSKTIRANVVGTRTYTGTSEKGKQYTSYYINIAYKDEDNKYVDGYNVESIRYKEPLKNGEYDLVVVTQKVNDKYYKEIVSADYIEEKKK